MKSALPIAFVVIAVVALGAQDSAPRFRFERAVQPAGAGPNRLAVDVPLLVGAAPLSEAQLVRRGERVRAREGVRELRFVDAAGREVPYLFVPPPVSEPVWVQADVLPVASTEKALAGATTEKTSGFEADLGSVVLIDRIQVMGLPAPFLKRAVVEGSGDREHWTMLVPEGTLFDLPSERLRRLEFEFRAGEYRYVRVTWDDTNSGRVPPPRTVTARRAEERVPETSPLTAPIAFERRSSEPGRSRFRLRLPAARLPVVALDLQIDAPYLMREALVTESRFDGRQLQPVQSGSALLRRVTKDALRADELAIPIGLPQTAELELVVDDGDNPPLVLAGVTAVFAEFPTIYFESDGSALVARYGEPKLSPPQYDLEAARPGVRLDTAASATWGAPTPVTTTEMAPAPPMPATGTVLDASAFRYARAMPAEQAGLMAVALDAAVLAHSRGTNAEFSDVRVLDGAGRQIPYVLERRDEPLSLPLTLQRKPDPPAGAPKATNQSWYSIQLPYEQLPPARLVLETSARVFQRQLSVMHVPPQDPRQRTPPLSMVASARWVEAEADLPASPLVLDIPSLSNRELFLAVDEGDNSPLPLQRATLLLPSYRVRFFRPDTSRLTLVYGRDDLGPPQYDLALLAPQVLSAAANETAADAEGAGPRATTQDQELVKPVVFWSALALALAVLLGIIVRLLRKEPVPLG